jgi:hypothetical protein
VEVPRPAPAAVEPVREIESAPAAVAAVTERPVVETPAPPPLPPPAAKPVPSGGEIIARAILGLFARRPPPLG